MCQRRTGWGLSRCFVIAIPLLLLWTATNALAQTDGDVDNVTPDDDPDATSQRDDSADAAAADIEPTIPSLDLMLRIALQHNPDIRAGRAEVEVAEANLERTRLTVVKELTAYRDRWLSATASLATAREQLVETRRLHEQGFVTDDQVVTSVYRVSVKQLQLRELETELPYLLGHSLDAGNQRLPTTGVEQRTTLLRDEAIPLAEQILALSLQSYRGNHGDLQRCLRWSLRLMQLERDTADSEAGRNAAAEAHLERLQSMGEIAKALHLAGVGELEDTLEVEFAIIEVQAMLEGGVEE